MRDQVFTILQAIGRSFMLPVAILPIAGLLLGIGASFTNATTILMDWKTFLVTGPFFIPCSPS